jgi:Rrf2 family protein
VLQLNKRTEYGLIALTHLAARHGEVVSAREIGEQYPVPRRLLAEVLKDLCRLQFVESHRGATGGYTLRRPAHEIRVGDVVEALEGKPSIGGCESLEAHRGGSCDVEPVCPIRSPIQKLRASIWSLLQRTTLSDMARGGAAEPPRRSRSLPSAQPVQIS